MAEESKQHANPQDQETTSQEGGIGAVMVRGSLTVNTPPKVAWPEVVGLTVEDAEKKIKEDMPEVSIQVVPPDHFVTMDYNRQRVRLYVDSLGLVARPATVG